MRPSGVWAPALCICVLAACRREMPAPVSIEITEPKARATAIGRAIQWLKALEEEGIPTATLQASDPANVQYSGAPGELLPVFNLYWKHERGEHSFVSTRTDGSLAIFENGPAKVAERGMRDAAFSPAGLLEFGESFDWVTTESLHQKSIGLLRRLRPGTWHEYEPTRCLIDGPKHRAPGRVDSVPRATLLYQGRMNGLECEGMNAWFLYERVRGTLLHVYSFEIAGDYPSLADLKISEAKAEGIAKKFLKSKVYGRKSKSMVVCRTVKLAFPVNFDDSADEQEWDTKNPRLAHFMLVCSTDRAGVGWYQDEVTVDAVDGSVINHAHLLTIGPVPGADDCAARGFR